MRNIMQYPITSSEVLAALKKARDDRTQEIAPGDMRPTIYYGLENFLTNHPVVMESLLESMKIKPVGEENE